jgi:hypothetical protein
MMDPILTPLIVSGLTAAGLGSLATTTIIGTLTVAQALSFVIVAGASVGLYLLTAPPVPKPENGKIPVQEPVPPRQYCYGLARMSGALMLKETNIGPAGAGTSGGNLGIVIALASHPVDSFRHIYLNDNRAQFAGNPLPSSLSGSVVDTQADGRYQNHVTICIRSGAVPETYMSMFVSAFNFTNVVWPTTARGDGIASLGMACRDASSANQAVVFPYGAPNPSAVLAGYRVYDPRMVGQSPTNPATWTFSQNPALCIMHYLCFSEFGFKYPYDIAIAPVVDDWKHQANNCSDDIPVKPLSGGLTIKRYELGGYATTDNEQKAVLQAMLNACDGWLVRRGDGSCLIRVGKFEASGVTITDADIIGFSYQKGVGDEEAINRLDIQFTSQDHDWTQIECDPWDNSADQVKRGHVRESTMDLKWCQDYRMARRIAKREFYRQGEPLRGSLDLYLSGINAAYERWIYVQSDRIPSLSNRYIENRAARFVLTGDVPSIHIEFIGIDPTALEAWNPDPPQNDEGKAPPNLLDSNMLALAAVEIDALASTAVGGDAVLDIDFTWDEDSEPPDMDIRTRIKTPRSEWARRNVVVEPYLVGTNLWRVSSEAVPHPETLEVQIRRIATRGSRTPWSTIGEVNT